MPRFFFNHKTPDGQVEVDIDGIKLNSLNAALEEASFAAKGAVALADEPVQGEFQIEDEGRVMVARVPYAVAEDAPGEGTEAAAEEAGAADETKGS
ncbi:MAG TPA: hypothetical protein VIL88_03610 [Devosia sp.]|uniref:DUF6894 family protein n=1 Tax=Devosia sp. TaxID=1871048 RepID=UPI002F950E41